MRIITGFLKGRKLKNFKDNVIRPTPDRARETLFNIIGSSIVDSSFLDLFAGTGAVGIEAVSRGARETVFVESSPASAKIILANLNVCGIDIRDPSSDALQCSLIEKDVELTIREMGRGKRFFDFIFLDPPYREGYYLPILKSIHECTLLKSDGWVIAEHCSKNTLEFKEIQLDLFRNARVGDTSFSFFHNAA